MNRLTCVGLLVLAVLTCLLRPTDALKCVVCEECKESDKHFEPKECTRLHVPDSIKTFSKFVGLDKLVKDANDLGDKVRHVKTCFKAVTTSGDKDSPAGQKVTVARGCSGLNPDPQESCEVKESKNLEVCMYVCEKDGCNGATPPTSSKTALLTTCLLIAISFVLL